jgi:ATP-dependent DNA ligase
MKMSSESPKKHKVRLGGWKLDCTAAPMHKLQTAFSLPFAPMEAKLAAELPVGPEWEYEPKWDGFRCVALREGLKIKLQSKSGRPLTRYFPEIVEALGALKAHRFAVDGELIVPVSGRLSFDSLLQRIYPAASRIELLSRKTPAQFVLFDC